MDLALLSGALRLPEGMTRQEAYAVNWIPQAWPYIHPVQDVQGKTMEIQAGLSTRTRKVAEGGYDAETVDAEQASDNERADSLSLTYTSDGRQKAVAAKGEPTEASTEEPPATAGD